jgi:CHAT domain-containing protein
MSKRLCKTGSWFSFQEVTEGLFSSQELLCPGVDEVLRAITRFNIVHFACHGFSDAANPLNSHILLQKNEASGLGVDKLMLSVLLEVTRHGNVFTAFLSACSTAEVRATDLVDESIHIASAFRIADFRHVIISL